MLRKKLKVVICVLMSVTILLSGCTIRRIATNQETPVQEEEPTNDFPNVTEAPEDSQNPEENYWIIDTQNVEVQGEYDGYYYDQLSEMQKKIFCIILGEMPKMQEEYVGFRNATVDDCIKVQEAIHLSTINSYNSSFTLHYYEKDNTIFLKIEVENQIGEEQEEEIRQTADKILQEIDGESQEEIIIQIYNWCSANIMYDETANCRNLYGALVERTCVCVGYSKAFSYLCSKKGIYTMCVKNDDHMWNYVLLGDKWYAVDATNGEESTTKFLMKGKEILNTEDYFPTSKYFSFPELAEQSLYPNQEYAEEFKSALEQDIEACDKQMRTIEEYYSEDNFDEYNDRYYSYARIKELATEILNNINGTLYCRYINTEECSEKSKEIEDLIVIVNNYEW